MSHVKVIFRRYWYYVMTRPMLSTLLLLIGAGLLIRSYLDGTLLQATGYLLGVGLCVLVTDLVIEMHPIQRATVVIRQPVKKELCWIVTCTVLGLVFLLIRIFSDWQHLGGIVKIGTLSLIVFMFPIVLAVVYLFKFKYTFRELGINLNYWYLPLLIHPVWGGITLLVAPDRSHWQQAFAEYGIFEFLFTGLVTAALSEEFTRFLWQTRVGRATNSSFTGIFIAALVWSAMHIPVNYRDDPAGFTAWTPLAVIVCLMPIGLFWGYLTHRTQSLFPVLMMHGFNLWGLQNI